LKALPVAVSMPCPCLSLARRVLAAHCCVRVMSLFVGVLQGYAQFVDMWWHGPEVIMTLLALCALLLGSGSVPRLAARGMVALFLSLFAAVENHPYG